MVRVGAPLNIFKSHSQFKTGHVDRPFAGTYVLIFLRYDTLGVFLLFYIPYLFIYIFTFIEVVLSTFYTLFTYFF